MFQLLKPLLKMLALAALRAGRSYVQTNLTAYAAILVPLIDYVEANLDAILDSLLAEIGSMSAADQQAAIQGLQAALGQASQP